MTVTKHAAVLRLEEILSRPDGAWTLTEAMLAVSALLGEGAASEREGDDAATERLASIAREARTDIGGAEHPRFVAGSLSRSLFDRRGLEVVTGETRPEHYDLRALLENGEGAQELVTTFLIEVSRLCRNRFDAVGLPGRLLVARQHGEKTLLFEANANLRPVEPAEFERLILESSGGRHRFSERFLRPITSEQLVARFVGGLKACVWRLNRFELALGSVQMMLAIRPDDPREIRDQGRLLFLLGRHDEAIRVLETYLSHNPAGEDAEAVRMLIREARQNPPPEAERA